MSAQNKWPSGPGRLSLVEFQFQLHQTTLVNADTGLHDVLGITDTTRSPSVQLSNGVDKLSQRKALSRRLLFTKALETRQTPAIVVDSGLIEEDTHWGVMSRQISEQREQGDLARSHLISVLFSPRGHSRATARGKWLASGWAQARRWPVVRLVVRPLRGNTVGSHFPIQLC